MEAVFFGTYALFFCLAVILFVLPFFKRDILAAIICPYSAAILWFILAVLSFTVYTDQTTVWNQWMIAPLCSLFGIASALIGTLNIFDLLKDSGNIQVEED